jgi:uncharacterized RDD family membrane protein YckC
VPVVAGDPGARLTAQVIDTVVVCVVMGVVALIIMAAMGLFDARNHSTERVVSYQVILVLTAVASAITYEALMLHCFDQTIGKWLAGLLVVRPDGHRLSLGQAFGRATARIALTVIPYGIGVFLDGFFIVITGKSCLHDLVARTRVVARPANHRGSIPTW